MIDHETQIMAVLGNPIEQSLSPLMHNAVFRHLSLNCVYLPFAIPTNKVETALEAVKLLGFKGINITIPFKEKVLEYLDELSMEAQACQAVNCIKNENGRLIGYNTDGKGFMAALNEVVMPSYKHKAVLIGAGGAARSIAYNLAKEGYKMIDILDIEIGKAINLATFLEDKTTCIPKPVKMNIDNFNKCCYGSQLVVNCSPVGMVPHIEQSPVESFVALPANAVVCDLVYNPPMTRFLQLAQARGLKTVNGTAMFVHQGALTLAIILGINPPLALMKDVVTDRLNKKRFDIN